MPRCVVRASVLLCARPPLLLQDGKFLKKKNTFTDFIACAGRSGGGGLRIDLIGGLHG